MKKTLKRLLIIIFLIGLTTTVTGCFEKRKEIKFTDDNITVTFKVKEDTNYKLSKDVKEFRSSREDATIFAKDFSIGIDISDEISYKEFNNDFTKLLNSYKKEKDFKEVSVSGLKGFQKYNISYIRYEVYLPIKNDNTKNLIINIYSNANKDEVTKQIYESNEIKDIINHLSVTVKKK